MITFSELIDSNIAPSYYSEDTIGKSACGDGLSLLYNNQYAVWTDTSMSRVREGEWRITGNMIKWQEQLYKMYSFFSQNNLTWEKSSVNGAPVIKLHQRLPEECPVICDYGCCKCYNENCSKIPHPVGELTTNGDANKFNECMKSDNVIKALNESLYVKGNNWGFHDNKIVGQIGNKMIFIEIPEKYTNK